MKPIHRISLVDTVVEQLQAEISSGAWPIGTRIPSESELVEQLEVSRPSVREAVRSLVQLGLLETRQGQGTYVVADDPTEVALRRTLGGADAHEVLTVRRALDVLAAREAAEHRTEADLAVLRELLAGRKDAIRDQNVEDFATLDVAFHIAVAAASHNRLLAGIYASFDGSLRHSVQHDSCLSGNSDPNTADLHEALLQALTRADPDAAAAAATGVLDQTEQWMHG